MAFSLEMVGCCTPSNCIELWTTDDELLWCIDIHGSIDDIPWKTHELSGDTHWPLGGVVPLLDWPGSPDPAFIPRVRSAAMVYASEMAWSYDYTPEADLEIDRHLQLNFAEGESPSCGREICQAKQITFPTENVVLLDGEPPATITKNFDRMLWAFPLVHDSVIQVSVPSGINGDGPTIPVLVYYNSAAGLGPHDPFTADRAWFNTAPEFVYYHAGTISGGGGVVFGKLPAENLGEFYGYMNPLGQYQPPAPGEDGCWNCLAEKLDDAVINANVRYRECGSFSDGKVCATVDNIAQTVTLRTGRYEWRWEGYVITSSYMDSTLGSDYGASGNPVGLRPVSWYSGGGDLWVGSGQQHASAGPNFRQIYLSHLLAALGEPYDEDKAYIMSIRARPYWGHDSTAPGSPYPPNRKLSLPFYGSGLPHGSGPDGFLTEDGTAVNNVFVQGSGIQLNWIPGFWIDADCTYSRTDTSPGSGGVSQRSERSYIPGEYIRHCGQKRDGDSELPDETRIKKGNKLWKKPELFDFPLDEDASTIPGTSSGILAERDQCPAE